ncbi:uncharacterized protein V1518DRAFT_378070, partial [Limtongia smithiae]|uniref:uncharacterized protein n=1 Tax=Limtongia smithiae TaxID=1125753 RepID=UPI0034CF4BE8
GSDWYWTVFFVKGVACLEYMGCATIVTGKWHFFHYTSTASSLFTCIAYFSMATNLAWACIQTVFDYYFGGNTD